MKIMATILTMALSLAAAPALVPFCTNGGFEIGDGLPEGWKVEPSAIACVLSRDLQVFHSGKASGKMVTEATNKKDWPAWEQTVEGVAPGQRWEAEVWARTRCGFLPGFAYIAIEFLGEDGKRVGFRASPSASGDSDWTKLAVKVNLPEKTAKLKLRLIFHGAGTAWFDDAKLVRNDAWQAEPKVSAKLVRLSATGKVANPSFLGFGAEIDPWLWNAENRSKGVDEADAQLIASRVREMRLPLARIFIQWAIFNPSGDRTTFDFESDGMQSLVKTLTLCQTNGMQVIVCGVEWGKKPYDDPPAAAKAWAELMAYLVKTRGFTCIRWWEAWNEPNHGWRKMGYDFERYIRVHELVRDAFKARGLGVDMLGSDDSGDLPWFTETAKRMPDRVQGYATHHYVPFDDLENAAARTRDRLAAMKANDPEWQKKKLILAEFGIHGPATTDRNNLYMRTFDCGLGIAALCIDQAQLGIDGASIWCLHRIHYPGFNFMDYGLWEYKNEDWKPRPVWYAYSLLSRFMPRGSRILEIDVKDGEGLVKAVLAEGGEGRCLFVANQSYGDVPLSFDAGSKVGKYVRYLYDGSITNALGTRPLYLPEKPVPVKGELKDLSPKRSLAVYQMLL